jgi:hypothetical protein
MFPKCSRKKSKSLGTLDIKNANPLRISVLDVPNFGNPRRERLFGIFFEESRYFFHFGSREVKK